MHSLADAVAAVSGAQTMFYRRGRPLWGYGIVVRIPGCLTQAIAGAFVLGLMVLLALIISAFQLVLSLLPR